MKTCYWLIRLSFLCNRILEFPCVACSLLLRPSHSLLVRYSPFHHHLIVKHKMNRPFYRHKISISTSFWSLLKVGRLTNNLNHSSSTSSSSGSSSPILKWFLSPVLDTNLEKISCRIRS